MCCYQTFVTVQLLREGCARKQNLKQGEHAEQLAAAVNSKLGDGYNVS